MNKDNKIVPELRFPEFLNMGEWVECSIDSIGNVVTGGTPSKEEKEFWDGNFVWITAQDFKEKYIFNSVLKLTQKGKDKSRVIPKNSVLVTCIASIGLNAINKVECATNQQINTIVCNAENHYEFVYYAISQNINKLKNLAGQTAVPIINKSVFEKFTIHKPKSSDEQQKISSCLSSLDELISAHTQKLDALKDHKKGLMQQLFPAEGETVPKLRFKKFEKDGEWDLIEFSKYIELYRGSSPRPIQDYLTKEIDGVNWIKIGDTKYAKNFIINRVDEKITPVGANKSRKVSIGELILANSMSFGKTYELAIDGYIYDGWFVLRNYEDYYEKQFLLQLLNSDYMQNQYKKLSAGGIVQNISSDIVYKTIVPHTKKSEQQKIANFLSSIDDEITAQSQKIEALKEHKKGLMQGLFPVINE